MKPVRVAGNPASFENRKHGMITYADHPFHALHASSYSVDEKDLYDYENWLVVCEADCGDIKSRTNLEVLFNSLKEHYKPACCAVIMSLCGTKLLLVDYENDDAVRDAWRAFTILENGYNLDEGAIMEAVEEAIDEWWLNATPAGRIDLFGDEPIEEGQIAADQPPPELRPLIEEYV